MNSKALDLALKHNLPVTIVLLTGGELNFKDIALHQGWDGWISGTRVHMIADAKGDYTEGVCHGQLYDIPFKSIACLCIKTEDIPKEEG